MGERNGGTQGQATSARTDEAYSWAHRRGADGAYIKARKVACWAWGVTPPIGPHSHWSDLFGKMLVRAIKRRTISAKRTQHPTLNTQYSILNTQYSTLNTQHSILNTYHSILNTQYSTLNSQHSILNTQRATSNTQSSTLNTQHSTPNTQCSVFLGVGGMA